MSIDKSLFLPTAFKEHKMSMVLDFKNENDFKLDRGKVRTAGADWMWVMMTFQTLHKQPE